MRRVRWSEKASDQIVAAFQAMTEYGEDFAGRQSELIWNSAEMLGEFPFMGPPLSDPERQIDLNERYFFVPGTHYFIFYRVDEDIIHITAIVYAPLLDLTEI